MGRRRNKAVKVSGLISIPEWGMESIADVALTTDSGRIYFLLDSEEVGDPYDWVDKYVEVVGHVTTRDGRTFLAATDIREEYERMPGLEGGGYYDVDEDWGVVDDDYDSENEYF